MRKVCVPGRRGGAHGAKRTWEGLSETVAVPHGGNKPRPAQRRMKGAADMKGGAVIKAAAAKKLAAVMKVTASKKAPGETGRLYGKFKTLEGAMNKSADQTNS